MIPHNNYKHDPNVLSGFTGVCWSTLSGCRVPPVRSARTAPKPLVAWKRWTSECRCTPCEFPTLQQSGVIGRDDCTMRWALTSRRSQRAVRRRSRVSQSGCTHAQETGQQTDYRNSHGDRPHMAIADVHHICHICQVKCTRKQRYTATPSPQFPVPQRGRKRLSRGATLHTELALEWPELVQIGRCKVQWPPTDLNKQILTSFWKYKTITQHYLPLGVVSTPKRSHTIAVSSTGLSRSIIFCSSSG